MAYGSHRSAELHQTFLREELADMVEAGHWLVLPYYAVRSAPDLRISPLGVVPQRDRRPRPIVDYTFTNINADTLKLAPTAAMQFGKALERLLYKAAQADLTKGPILASKYDLADAFMRVSLSVTSILKLAVAVPTLPGETPLVAVPLVLPMGWLESPPTFCSITETIADLANARIQLGHTPQPTHRHETVANTAPPSPDWGPPAPLLTPPNDPVPAQPAHFGVATEPLLEYVDVFMDDFILLTQGPTIRQQEVRRILLECLDMVIRPLDSQDRPERKEAASIKKLLKGDGCQLELKTVLGWVLNLSHRTIQLPASRSLRLAKLLASLPHTKKRASRKLWSQVLGELRSMVLAIPGGKGLFSHLQRALKPTPGRLRLTQAIHDELDDWRWLTNNLHARPTSWDEIVPSAPTHIGSHDAAALGMGGVWFAAHGTSPVALPPLLWRQRFDPDITASLVTFDNPRGATSNSALELAGHVAHNDILTSYTPTPGLSLSVYTDNTPTLYWTKKGSTSSGLQAAYLLRLQALHQRHFGYHVTLHHIAGTANVMADDCSRLWHLDDAQLLTHFDLTYPQSLPWQLCTLRPEMHSAIHSALQKQRQQPEWFLAQLTKPKLGGPSGWPNVPTGALTPSKTPVPLSPATTWLPLPTTSTWVPSPRAASPASLGGNVETALRSVGQTTPFWGPTTTTPASSPRASSSLPSNANFSATPKKTPLPPAWTPSQWTSSKLRSASAPPPAQTSVWLI